MYLSSAFVAPVTRGIHRALPGKLDSVHAFQLLAYHPQLILVKPPHAAAFLLKLGTLLGFVSMLRFNVFAKLKLSTIILIDAFRRQVLLPRNPLHPRVVSAANSFASSSSPGKEYTCKRPPAGQLLPQNFKLYQPGVKRCYI